MVLGQTYFEQGRVDHRVPMAIGTIAPGGAKERLYTQQEIADRTTLLLEQNRLP